MAGIFVMVDRRENQVDHALMNGGIFSTEMEKEVPSVIWRGKSPDLDNK